MPFNICILISNQITAIENHIKPLNTDLKVLKAELKNDPKNKDLTAAIVNVSALIEAQETALGKWEKMFKDNKCFAV